MDNTGERSLLQQILRFQAPCISCHTITAGSVDNRFRRGTIPGYPAVYPSLFQRNPFLVIIHDHGQRRSPALQCFQLHNNGHLDHTFFLRLWYCLVRHFRSPFNSTAMKSASASPLLPYRCRCLPPEQHLQEFCK